eukprot:TRINITY_DN34382_c0_g1_i1.p1 TRINITY_DN34382_c0_g1~~TRINITY_DN34382_c0_g1_i1.p1  ORF type:complete len:1822 (-),score=257.08 TRINITY_DN34382_c0_g1_i1:433-5898(-)
MEQVWVPHPVHVWLPCTLQRAGAKTKPAEFTTDDGEVVSIPAERVNSLIRVSEEDLHGMEDVSSLPSVHAGSILHSVRVRFARREIYTRVGRILLSVNPFMPLPIFSAKYIDDFARCVDSSHLPPHIFGIGRDALTGIKESDQNQAVIISGESGAGKTEAVKSIMVFIIEAQSRGTSSSARRGATDLDGRLLRTNQVLEAFGNSMTVRNKNSSRFCKWTDLELSSDQRLHAATIAQYMLEASRVCSQSAGDRSFHIFFQLLKFRDSPQYHDLRLEPPSAYRYLNGGQLTISGVDDAVGFQETTRALDDLGFSTSLQAQIWRVVGGILSIGNCDFRASGQGENLEIVQLAELKHAAELLQMDADVLLKLFLWKKISVGGETTLSPLRLDQAKAIRDGFSRWLYELLVRWLVATMNAALQEGDESTDGRGSSQQRRFIGILDIAGFENFAQNSLEQLLINLANEHMQIVVNHFTINVEIEDCLKEGITRPFGITVEDDTGPVELIDAKHGILDLLEDEARMAKATDKSFVDRLLSTHKKNAYLLPPSVRAPLGFGIKHYAGSVMYSCSCFVEKSRDKKPDGAVDLLNSSCMQLMRELAAFEDGVETSKTQAAKSATSFFRSSLRLLMKKINAAKPHIVRCIKPNQDKVPDKFDSVSANEQLRLSGVLEVARLRQYGFTMRIEFSNFIEKYGCLCGQIALTRLKVIDRTEKLPQANPKAAVEAILNKLRPAMKCGDDEFAVGKTKVFLKGAAHRFLDICHNQLFLTSLILLQSRFRARIARARFMSSKKSRVTLMEWLQQFALIDGQAGLQAALPKDVPRGLLSKLGSREKAALALAKANTIVEQLVPTLWRNDTTIQGLLSCVQVVSAQLSAELQATDQLQELAKSVDPMAITLAVARARGLCIPEVFISEVEERGNILRVQLPIAEAFRLTLEGGSSSLAKAGGQNLTDDVCAGRLREIFAEAERLGLVCVNVGDTPSETWIPELNGKELCSQAHRWLRRYDESAASALSDTASLGKASASQAASPTKADSIAGLAAPMQASSVSMASGVDPSKSVDLSDSGSARRLSRRQTSSGSIGSKSGGRRSIIGLDQQDQARTLALVSQAVKEFDAVALEGLLRLTTRLGLVGEELKRAEVTLQRLQDRSFLVEACNNATLDAESEVPSISTLRQLQNLSQQIRNIQGDHEVAQVAARALQKGAKRLSMRKGVGRASLHELELERPFMDLANFSKLKNPRSWAGHRGSGLLTCVGAFGRDNMLNHSKVPISAALTRLPENRDEVAVQNFRNLLYWMGDRAYQECHRLAALESIVELARSDRDIRDEIYVQTLKQLRKNPSARSTILGWQLLRKLFNEALVGDELAEFVRVFLFSTIRTQATGVEEGGAAVGSFSQSALVESQGYARECLSIFQRRDASMASGGHSSSGAWQSDSVLSEGSAMRQVTFSDPDHCVVGIVFHLLDWSKQHLYAKVRSTLRELSAQAGHKLGIRRWRDFSFFQIWDAGGTTIDPNLDADLFAGSSNKRLMSADVQISDLFSKWQQIKETTGRTVRLFWLRRYIRPDEMLSLGDPLHAALTYRQALLAHLKNGVSTGDSMDVLIQIAASILCVEYDCATTRLKETGFLERLLPAHCANDLSVPNFVGKWREVVMDEAKGLRTRMGPLAEQHARMSRLFAELQRTQFFGAHTWSARYTAVPRSEQAAVADPPTNFWQGLGRQDQDVRIFVDLLGVHLLRIGNVGKGTVSFLYPSRDVEADGGSEVFVTGEAQTDHADHVFLRWGARPGLFQMVVRKPGTSGDMLVTIASPRALDISFVVHAALSEASRDHSG